MVYGKAARAAPGSTSTLVNDSPSKDSDAHSGRHPSQPSNDKTHPASSPHPFYKTDFASSSAVTLVDCHPDLAYVDSIYDSVIESVNRHCPRKTEFPFSFNTRFGQADYISREDLILTSDEEKMFEDFQRTLNVYAWPRMAVPHAAAMKWFASKCLKSALRKTKTSKATKKILHSRYPLNSGSYTRGLRVSEDIKTLVKTSRTLTDDARLSLAFQRHVTNTATSLLSSLRELRQVGKTHDSDCGKGNLCGFDSCSLRSAVGEASHRLLAFRNACLVGSEQGMDASLPRSS